jgi:hypothetical protein
MLFGRLSHRFESGTGILPVQSFSGAEVKFDLSSCGAVSIFTCMQLCATWVLLNISLEPLKTRLVSYDVIEVFGLPHGPAAIQRVVDSIGRVGFPGMNDLFQLPVTEG